MSTAPPPGDPGSSLAGFDVAGTVRRARRAAGMSVRAMAAASGVPASVIGRAETGQRALRVDQLVAVLAVAGFGLMVVDGEGAAQQPMRPDGVRDRAGRRMPAHVDVRHADEVRDVEEWRRDRPMPWFSYRRAAPVHDDHPAAGPRDSPTDRAQDRRRAAWATRRREVAIRHAARVLQAYREEDPLPEGGQPARRPRAR